MIKNTLPLISIIIPYYDPIPEYFKDAIYSVLSQSYQNWELIIVNDGSNIKNKLLLENFIGGLTKKKISIINLDRNCGVATARNKGIEYANGDIITFLATDDLYLPWHCQEVVDNFLKYPDAYILASSHVLYTAIWKIKKFFYNAYFKTLLNENKESYPENIEVVRRFAGQKLVFKNKVFKIVKYDESFKTLEDSELQLQILSTEELHKKIAVVPLTGHIYRLYSSKKRLSNKKTVVLESVQKLIEKHGNKIASDDKLKYSLTLTSNYLKLNELLKDYLLTNFFWQFLKEDFIASRSLKDKIKSVKKLFKAIVCNFLMLIFGIDGRQMNILISGENKSWLKTIFDKNMTKMKDENILLYANKVYKRIF